MFGQQEINLIQQNSCSNPLLKGEHTPYLANLILSNYYLLSLVVLSSSFNLSIDIFFMSNLDSWTLWEFSKQRRRLSVSNESDILPIFQIVSRFDFLGTSNLQCIYISVACLDTLQMQCTKKVKWLTIWNGGHII